MGGSCHGTQKPRFYVKFRPCSDFQDPNRPYVGSAWCSGGSLRSFQVSLQTDWYFFPFPHSKSSSTELHFKDILRAYGIAPLPSKPIFRKEIGLRKSEYLQKRSQEKSRPSQTASTSAQRRPIARSAVGKEERGTHLGGEGDSDDDREVFLAVSVSDCASPRAATDFAWAGANSAAAAPTVPGEGEEEGP